MVDSGVEQLANAVSRVLGWTYVLCWSLSFYPQPLLNWRRKSTVGLAVDFPTINVLGFLCYGISTAAFLYSPEIRRQYAIRNPVSPKPTVRGNDLAFALHAVVLSILVYSQFFCWGFKRERGQRISKPVMAIILSCITAVALVCLMVATHGGHDAAEWAWIDVIYTLGYVKLVITIVKYIPQAWVNYKRQSTVGWSIHQILLDVAGGVLSILQLVLDSSLQNDWSGLTGNPVKLGLGNISIFFDVIFVVQHYCLYRHAREKPDDAFRPLLRMEGDDDAEP
ncbi:MAG: hypothetical protein M1838_000097 [Thelocarpon superellum]|nr:MAG: hypothetical protein M1838_000097 [Thelocarpon superellum]